MDPLSVTSAVVGLTFQCGKAVCQIKDAFGRYQEAPDTLDELEDECTILRATLEQLQSVLTQHPELGAAHPLDDVYSLALRGSEALLLCIEDEFRSLMVRSDWGARVAVLWKEQDMARLVRKLERKKSTVVLLMQWLSLGSMREIRLCLRNNERHLDVSRQELVALMPSYPNVRPSIIQSLDSNTVSSVVGYAESVLSTTEFDFDYELINTTAYRTMLARMSTKKRAKTIPNEHTIKDETSTLLMGEDLIDLSSNFDVPPISTPSYLRLAQDLDGLDFRPTHGRSMLDTRKENENPPNGLALSEEHDMTLSSSIVLPDHPTRPESKRKGLNRWETEYLNWLPPTRNVGEVVFVERPPTSEAEIYTSSNRSLPMGDTHGHIEIEHVDPVILESEQEIVLESGIEVGGPVYETITE